MENVSSIQVKKSTLFKFVFLGALVIIIGLLFRVNVSANPGEGYDSLEYTQENVESVTGQAIISEGKQEINMDVNAGGYSPNSFVLKKGVPVKWNINVKQLNGCNRAIRVDDYGIYENLKQGMNVIEFTPEKTGTIVFSCGMGMYRGSFVVTEDGTASETQIKAAAQPRGHSCGGGCGGCGG